MKRCSFPRTPRAAFSRGVFQGQFNKGQTKPFLITALFGQPDHVMFIRYASRNLTNGRVTVQRFAND